jgi:hypothetical protein
MNPFENTVATTCLIELAECEILTSRSFCLSFFFLCLFPHAVNLHSQTYEALKQEDIMRLLSFIPPLPSFKSNQILFVTFVLL